MLYIQKEEQISKGYSNRESAKEIKQEQQKQQTGLYYNHKQNRNSKFVQKKGLNST